MPITRVNDDPRHQPGAPLTKNEKRTIAMFATLPVAAALLVAPVSAFVSAATGAGGPDSTAWGAAGLTEILAVVFAPLWVPLAVAPPWSKE